MLLSEEVTVEKLNVYRTEIAHITPSIDAYAVKN